MSLLQDIEWEDCYLEPRRDRELERYVRRSLGGVPVAVHYFSVVPWIVRWMVSLTFSNGLLVHTDLALADLLWLVVSQDNSCRYCYGSQRAALRILGFSEARIRRLEEDLFRAEVDARERPAIDFARLVSRANPLPSAADLEMLRDAGYAEGEIKELVFIASSIVASNQAATIAALPREPIERLTGSRLLMLLRPLAARILRSRFRKGRPEPLPPELETGPFSYAVRAFAGLPIARALRGVLDDCWDSRVLPSRAKALVFAVVARGLDCAPAEREARRLLSVDGLDGEPVDEILAHLASPELEPIEAAIVLFARETIRYQPAAIQRRGRALRDEIGEAEFVELLATVGLASTVCRVGVVADAF